MVAQGFLSTYDWYLKRTEGFGMIKNRCFVIEAVTFAFASMYIIFYSSLASTDNMQLQTRESRRKWETDFSSVIIAPVLKVR